MTNTYFIDDDGGFQVDIGCQSWVFARSRFCATHLTLVDYDPKTPEIKDLAGAALIAMFVEQAHAG